MAGETNSGIYKIDGWRIIAASAQRAGEDSEGNVISSTYLSAADFNTFTASADVTEYSAGTNIDITSHVISGKDWSSDIEDAASGASADAIAAVANNFQFDANDKISAYNGSAFAGEKYTAGAGIAIDGNNEISVSGDYVTSAAASLNDKLLVLHNNAWEEMPGAEGGFLTASPTGADDHPDVANPSTKYIYLVKITTAVGDDKYSEWIFTSADVSTTAWEKIGDTSIDLSQYVTTATTAADNWDVVAYSGADGVSIIGHEIGLSADYLAAVQDVSGKLDSSTYATDSATFYTTANPSGFITSNEISSTEWNSVYETVSANSANWQDTYTIITVPDLSNVPDVAP